MSGLNVIKFDISGHPETGLAAWEAISPEIIESGNPVQRGHTYFSTEVDKFSAGIWECSPMQRVPATLARSELMHILEGSDTITNADGIIFELQAGDTFLVPIGMGYQ